MRKNYDLVGQHINHLTVISKYGKSKDNRILWLCKCDCGNEAYITTSNLLNGHNKSCGCLHGRNMIRTKERLYSIYKCMKTRCFYNSHKSYSNYGGRGITICKEWLDDFMNFYNWAIDNGYDDNLTIDRIDTNGNYEPSNCRWVTMKEQERNRRNTIWIYYNGQTKPLAQWAEDYNIKYATLKQRIFRNKWSIEKALLTTTN